jgi:lipopolysaccharide transport system permease protein
MLNKSGEFNIVIASGGTNKQYVKELFHYRELFYFFAWRDIVVRYKQTVLGVLWAILRPLINMAVFVLVFGKIARLGSTEVNYPLFVLSGLLPWQLFTTALIDGSSSLVNGAPIISKVYFPRIILPFTSMVVGFVDFLISLTMFFVLASLLGAFSGWTFLSMPVFIFLTLTLCLGTSLWISALTVRYRDLRFLVPFVVQFGIFISPVGYSSFLLPQSYLVPYFLNPMVGIIEGFRWCCLGVYHPDLPLAVAISSFVNMILLITGFRYFRKIETTLADII